MTFKFEISLEFLLLQQKGKPKHVICPHAVKGDLLQGKPLGAHFWEQKEENENSNII